MFTGTPIDSGDDYLDIVQAMPVVTSVPSAPAVGTVTEPYNRAGRWYSVDDAGVEHPLDETAAAAAAAAAATAAAAVASAAAATTTANNAAAAVPTNYLRDDADDATTANILTQQPAAGNAELRLVGGQASFVGRDNNASATVQAMRFVSSGGSAYITGLNDDYTARTVNHLELRVGHGAGVRVGEAPGGVPAYGAINATGIELDGVDITTRFLAKDADDTTVANVLTQQPAAGNAEFRLVGDQASVVVKDDNAAATVQALRFVSSGGSAYITSLNDDFTTRATDNLELRVGHGAGIRVGNAIGGLPTYGVVNANDFEIEGVPIRSTSAGLTGLNVLEGTVGASTNQIRVGAGVCVDTTMNTSLSLAATMTKRVDAAWAAGSGNGAVLGGTTVAANSHATVWAIKNTTTGVVDVAVHTSVLRATVLAALPAGYDALQYLGSVLSTAAGTHDAFLANGPWVFLRTPKLAFQSSIVPDKVWTTSTVGMPPDVVGNFTVNMFGSATANAAIGLALTWPGADVSGSPTESDQLIVTSRTPSVGTYPVAIRALGQVDNVSRVTWSGSYSASYTPARVEIHAHGWFDPNRGNL